MKGKSPQQSPKSVADGTQRASHGHREGVEKPPWDPPSALRGFWDPHGPPADPPHAAPRSTKINTESVPCTATTQLKQGIVSRPCGSPCRMSRRYRILSLLMKEVLSLCSQAECERSDASAAQMLSGANWRRLKEKGLRFHSFYIYISLIPPLEGTAPEVTERVSDGTPRDRAPKCLPRSNKIGTEGTPWSTQTESDGDSSGDLVATKAARLLQFSHALGSTRRCRRARMQSRTSQHIERHPSFISRSAALGVNQDFCCRCRRARMPTPPNIFVLRIYVGTYIGK